MAQKAKKELATRNAAKLNQTLYAALAVHTFYILLRILFFRSTFTFRSLLSYIILSAPSVIIHIWFERIGRPTYTSTPSASSSSTKGDLKSAGEDLDSKGLTEFLWDVVYWTWGVVVCVAAFGDRLWWLWAVIPGYGVYLAWSTFSGARQGMAGLTGGQQGEGAEGVSSGASKRQAKMEKRGGQRVAYR